MYQPIHKANQLLMGTGDVVVVTGWKPKEAVAKRLPNDWYAVIGQLYSPVRGINVLVRNLLANPDISKILILSITKEDYIPGGSRALYDFFCHGFSSGLSQSGQEVWKVNSKTAAYIDKDIPHESLQLLRDSVAYWMIDTSKYFEFVVENINQLDRDVFAEDVERFSSPTKSRHIPEVYPLPEVTPKIIPGELYGHRISGKTIAETWVKILHRIKTTGVVRPTGYDGMWQELIDLVAVVTDEPEGFYFPDPNHLPFDRKFLEAYIPQVTQDAPYAEGVKYTYGQRLRSWFGQDQIQQAVRKLINEIDSASAVMSLWDSGSGDTLRFGRQANASDHDHGGSPCLNHIWVRVVGNELSLTATFRSNDMFSAWPANAMALRALQRHIRDEIASKSDYNLTMGPLITISQSAHIYDDTWENVEQLLSTQYKKICNKRDYHDPAGNFVVSSEKGQIIAEQTTVSGEIVAIYRGKSAQSLYHQIAAAVPHLTTEHALYLGSELGKVEAALSPSESDNKGIIERHKLL